MPQISPLVTGDPTELGSFRLSGRVGEGGQGIVYLGVNDQGERAAIKLLHVKFSGDTIARSRFARELKAAQRVASFCTARVIEADLEGDTPYIASEYIDGRALRDLVDTDGPLTGTALDRLAIGTATALTAIHHASIVHRDFKPDNVLIAADGPRVVDFGIARIIDSTGTITSRAIGTPAYMAPEQIAGDDIGPYTDVFSWGATIAFAATGKAAFDGKSIAMVLNRILNHEVDVSMMAEPLQSVVRSALAKSPAERPSADQILLRLLGQSSTVGASTAVLTRGVQVASDDTKPFLRVSAGSITDKTGQSSLAPSGQGSVPTGPSSVVPSGQGSVAPGGQGSTTTGQGSGTTGGHGSGTTGQGSGTTGGQGSTTTGQGSAARSGQGAVVPGGTGQPAPLDPMAPADGGGPPYQATGPAVPVRRRGRARTWVVLVTVVVLLAAAAIALVRTGWPPLALGGAIGPTRTAEQEIPPSYSSVVDKAAESGRIVVGVKGDLPRVGLRDGDGFAGFDVEVAKLVAAGLGAKETDFVGVSGNERATALAEGKVDLVVATYSIDKSRTQFAGPYYLAHQDILVHAGSGIDSLDDLRGKRICALDIPAVGTVQDEVKVVPVAAGDYAACMDLLRSGKVDAVPGDDLILAGFAGRENLRYKILGAKLSNERYAVGIRDGDVTTCKAVKAIIADLYRTGAMDKLLNTYFGNVDFEMERKVPAMETC
ncbi:serine/threonine-protein kinase [Nonomuraea jiangxiensis]|uniref:Serine/threonine protein kinase n=1 Tax=Nonomuraea jiangxiensis TaxID=633440 RepID=A0A1G8FU92_9ACTN|nr:serine/threonine-protein kinase [Nonomuraea jiangxiensis]SDH85703.1 Serine/threonine protein kinase [Nonomuraea jiangxiensis]